MGSTSITNIEINMLQKREACISVKADFLVQQQNFLNFTAIKNTHVLKYCEMVHESLGKNLFWSIKIRSIR